MLNQSENMYSWKWWLAIQSMWVLVGVRVSQCEIPCSYSGIREYECMIRVGRNMCCCNHVDIVGPRVHDIHIVFDTVSMSVINLTRSVCLLSYHLYVFYPIITFTSPSPLVLARVPPVFHRHLICRINTGRSHWFWGSCTGLCKNIPAKFRESPSKCSAAHPRNALWRNISASHSPNLARMF